MLVLSRRQNEKIVFPNLGISIEVVRIGGKTVRIGVDAPPEIRVAREEIADAAHSAADVRLPMDRQLRHEFLNRLHTALLGLQVVQRKLEMGEAVDAEKMIGKVFRELHQIAAQLNPQQANSDGQRAAQGRRALIVEDDANEGQLLAEYLRMNGYHVEVVSDGLQAISYLRDHQRPDVVLLDMCMPRLNGPKTITSIRCEPGWRGLKLFAVSGADQRELGVETGPRGVDRWFSKPLDARALVCELNRELDKATVPA